MFTALFFINHLPFVRLPYLNIPVWPEGLPEGCSIPCEHLWIDINHVNIHSLSRNIQ